MSDPDTGMEEGPCNTPLPNPYVTVNIRWVDHWHGFMREEPETLKVRWSLHNSQTKYLECGVADTSTEAWLAMDAAHVAQLRKDSNDGTPTHD